MADPLLATPSGRPRARALGVPFRGTPGAWNALTDVPGVTVGYTTLIEGDDVRTGVTAILPRGRDGVGVPCAAGWFSLNGNGEMTGTTWISESGALSTPIAITNTHAVGPVHRGIIDWTAIHHPALAEQWLLPVVAETWDGELNDLNGPHVQPAHAVAALDAAASGPVDEGSVGGGTGMICYGFKGGSGTASRLVSHGADRYVVAAFVQANFGSRHELTVAGVPLGARLGPGAHAAAWHADAGPAPADTGAGAGHSGTGHSGRGVPPGAGSVIVLLATDAPLLPGQCTALARRASLGIGRTGTSGGHFSGDIFLAFSTANAGALTDDFPAGPPTAEDYQSLRFVPWGRIDPFYEAAVQAVEEAVLNVLVANEDMAGKGGRRVAALPHGPLREALRAAGLTTG